MSATRKNSYDTRRQQGPFRAKPGFVTFYVIGMEVSRQLPKHCTLNEIGRTFGISRQNAHTEAVIALGKLVYHARRSVPKQEWAALGDSGRAAV